MNKRIWIIGASTGIGREVARHLSQEGHRVALSARTKPALEELVKTLPQPDESLVAACDVTDPGSLQKAFKQITKAWGGLDVMIFAAGVYTPMMLKDFNLGICQDVLNVNLTGAFNVFDVMKESALNPNTPLHLVWVASVAGYRGLPSGAAYGASKAGLINFVEAQRTELRKCNTKVQVVNPGFVKTRLTNKNTFDMPMIMTPEKAAEKIVRGMKKRRFEIAFPWAFVLIMKTLSLLPNWLYFLIANKLDRS